MKWVFDMNWEMYHVSQTWCICHMVHVLSFSKYCTENCRASFLEVYKSTQAKLLEKPCEVFWGGEGGPEICSGGKSFSLCSVQRSSWGSKGHTYFRSAGQQHLLAALNGHPTKYYYVQTGAQWTKCRAFFFLTLEKFILLRWCWRHRRQKKSDACLWHIVYSAELATSFFYTHTWCWNRMIIILLKSAFFYLFSSSKQARGKKWVSRVQDNF